MTEQKTPEEIIFLRNEYSRFGARACPACEYQNGKFIKSCKLHEEIKEISTRYDALKVVAEKMREALENFVNKLDAVHNDSEYQAVWTLYQAHCGKYSGLQYVDEFQQAKQALTEYKEVVK